MRVPKTPSRSKKQFDLSIVIPAYREERRIGATLDALTAYLASSPFFGRKTVEVLVVAADAPDKTHEIVTAKQRLFAHCRLLKPGPRVGKGRDVQFGMVRARGRIVAYMDADLATPLHHLAAAYTACERGSDIVAGTRNPRQHHPHIARRMLSTAGNILFRLAGGIWIEDSQCGFKLFTARASQLCFSRLTIMGWGFDMEILAIAKANNLQIKSHRLNDWQDMPYSTFDMSLLRLVLSSLRDLAHIARHRLRGVYTQDV